MFIDKIGIGLPVRQSLEQRCVREAGLTTE